MKRSMKRKKPHLTTDDFHKNLMSSEISPDDIVQITDEKHAWFPALIVVTERREWGVIGFAYMPVRNDKPHSCERAYNRLMNGTFEKVGTAVIVVAEKDR